MFFLSILFSYLVLSFINSNATVLEAQTAGDWSKVVIDQNMEGRTAIGDINGDGKNDVVVHKWGVTRGASQGAELSWYEYPSWEKRVIKNNTNFFGDGVVIADVDGDGKQDVIASKGTPTVAEVWLYKNNGNTWEEVKVATVETNSETKDIEAHDMDGDGKKDIVVRTKHKTAVYYQTDYKTWVQAIRDTRDREGMALGDMDGDGDYDVILNGFWLENTGNRNVPGWPEHTFDPAWYQESGGGYQDNAATISIADMDKDGKNDIVICQAEKTGQPLNWYKSVNPKAGASGWTKHTIDVVDYCHSMHARDFNNDGHIDVMMVELPRKSGASAYIYLNNGSGGFQETKVGTGGGYKASVGDIDNDGDVDIVSANAWASEGTVTGKPIYMWRNGGGGTVCALTGWQRHVIDANKPWRSVLIDAKDLNGDGKPDIVTGGSWYKNPGNAGGSWQRNTIGEPLRNMGILHDFDGDGAIDILGTKGGTTPNANPSSNELVWAKNNGSGTFQIFQNIQQAQGDFLQGAVAGSIQGNQVALSWHANGGGVQLYTIPSNPTTQTWTRSFASTTSQDEELSLGDIDKDGDNDLLLGTKWLRNNGSSWSAHTISTQEPPDRNKLGDINGDGKLDAVVGFESVPINAPADIYWYEQPGDPVSGTWTPHKVATIVGPMSLDVADMDGDGDLDIVAGEHNLASPASARAIVFENVDGKGLQWNQHVIYTGDEHHDGTKIVDIDGDGDKDVISIGWGHSRVVLYENTGTCTGPPPVTPTTSPQPTIPPMQSGCTGAFALPAEPDPNPAPVEGYSKALQPGSVYKEFSVVSNLGSAGTWRVTGSGAPAAGTVFRNRFGPHTENPVNQIQVNDLQGAVSAELMLSAWSGHPGSKEKKIRVNDRWFDLPLHPNLPQTTEANYYSQWNPVIQIPIEVLKNGANELQGEVCARCVSWPQWGYMSAMIRVFYDPAQKSDVPSVQITSPSSNGAIADKQVIQTSAPGAAEIDILGYYNGLDENGDGHFMDWHHEYITPRSLKPQDTALGLRNNAMYIKRHIGSGSQVTWDTSLVPNQHSGAVKLLARAKSSSGLWRVSERVENLTLNRSFSVQMFRPDTLPQNFNSCRGNQSTTITVPQEYLSQVNTGVLDLRSWAGEYGQRILFNGTNVRDSLYPGSWALRSYAYSETYHTIAGSNVQSSNTFKVERDACANVHGIEVLAPGPTLLLQCGTPPVTDPLYCAPSQPPAPPQGGTTVTLLPPYNANAACTHVVGAGEQYATVGAALSAMGGNGAGKVVCVRDNKEYQGITRIDLSGAASNPLVIKSHPANATKPKFVDPRPYLNADTQWSSPIDVFGKNVVIDGLESARSAGRGIRVANTENVLLKDVVAHDSFGVAIAVLGSKNVVVDGCSVYRDRYQGSPECQANASCKTSTVGESIAVVDSENALVQNCVVRDQLNKNGGGGTFATLRSENVVVRNNEQYSNFVGPSLHPDNARNVVFENNLIAAVCGHVGGGSGFYQYDEVYTQQKSQNAYNTTVRNNLLVGMTAGLRLGGCEVAAGEFNGLERIGPCKSIDQIVENNTVIAMETHGFMVNMGRNSQDAGYTEVSGLRVANNIFYGKGQSGVGGWAYPGDSPGSQFFSGNVWSKTPRFPLPSSDVVAPNLTGVFQGNINPESCVTEAQVKQFVTTAQYNGKGANMTTIGNKEGLDYTITIGGTLGTTDQQLYCFEDPYIPPIYCNEPQPPSAGVPLTPPSTPAGCGGLAEAGLVDVTCPQYGADPTCASDSTAAIQKAVDDAYKSEMAVFFPEGTYCVSNTIDAKKVGWARHIGHEFIGSTSGTKPVIRLVPNAPGFNNPSSVKPVLFMYSVCQAGTDCESHTSANELDPANGFIQSIRNIDFEVEAGNDGAVAVRFLGAQGNSIENVTVRMKSGYAGFGNMVGTWSSLSNIEVNGGRYGITGSIPTSPKGAESRWPALTNVRLYDQSVAALANMGFTTWSISGLHIKKQSGPAIITPGGGGNWAGGALNIIDGVIELENPSREAIDNSSNQSITLMNTYFRNTPVISKSGQHTLAGSTGWTKVSEYGYGAKFDNRGVLLINGNQRTDTHIGTLTSEAPPENLSWRHSVDPAHNPSPDVILGRIAAGDKTVANVWDHGIFPTTTHWGQTLPAGTTPDVTTKLQALIDSGVETIFFPKGKYIISNTIRMGENTHFMGLANQFSGLMVSDSWQPLVRPTYVITTVDSPTASPKMSHFRISWPTEQKRDMFTAVLWRSGKTEVHDVQFRPNWAVGSIDNYDGQYPNIRFLFTGNAGGTFWGLGIGSNQNRNQHPGYRHALFDGTRNPLVIYGINPEDHNYFGRTDGWGIEIRNSANIAFLGSKQENHNTLRIDNSENIVLLGMSAYDNTTITNVNNINGSFYPKGYDGQVMMQEVFGGNTSVITKNKEVAFFKRGQVDYNAILGARTVDATPGQPPQSIPLPPTNIECFGGVAPGLSTQPCSIYKEFKLVNAWNNFDWRVTGTDATAEGAEVFLPNPVLDVPVDDLQHAVRAEVVIDLWGGHIGTQNKQIRINNNEWINIPNPRFELPANNPSTPANESDPMWYYYQMNPIFEIPLSQLRQGVNTIEGNAARCGNGTCISWPQWGMNAIMIRVFYDPAVKSGPVGAITFPSPNATINDYQAIHVAAKSEQGIERIDVIGNYYGYDENGDGFYQDWHRGYFVPERNGSMRDPSSFDISGHIGTARSNPGVVRWDTTWIADQAPGSVQLIARIKDNAGYWTVTSPIGGLTLSRPVRTVEFFPPDKESIMPGFGVRVGQTKSSTVTIPAGFNASSVAGAIAHIRTWNGILHGGGDPHGTYVLNGTYTSSIGGKNHHYAYTTPEITDIGVLKAGQNTFSFSSTTIHHHNEILWPGPGLTVRYGGKPFCLPLTPIPSIHLSPEPTEFPDILTGILISPIIRDDNQIYFIMGNPKKNGENGEGLGMDEIRVYIDGEVDEALFEQNIGNRVWVRGRLEEGENFSGEYERYAVTGPDDISFSRIGGAGISGIDINWSVIVPMSLVILLIAGTGVAISRRF